MPIPGDAMKGIFSRGANLYKTLVKDYFFGRTAVAGEHKLSESELQKFANELSDDNITEAFVNLFDRNPQFTNQNSLEAFLISQGKTVKTGDKLKVKGLDAVRSRYYKRDINDITSYSADNVGIDSFGMLRDARDMAATAAAGIVGFKATQLGISLLVGDS